MTPAKTVGPYFVDEKLNRSDVRESQVGIPLTLTFTSQLFFTDAQNRQVLADSRYSAHGSTPDTTDATDNIYANDSSLLLQPTGDNASGYAAQFSVGVAKSTSQLNNTSAGAGGAGPGAGPAGDTTVGGTLASVTSTKVGGRRRMRVSITSTETVDVVARLTRGGKTLATRSTSVATGTTRSTAPSAAASRPARPR
jgi:hypothetical protein